MESILDVAKYIADKYREVAKGNIDELKLQKLLYFAQREHIAITGEPLFKETLEGWRYGPVSPLVRSRFDDGDINAETDDVSAEAAYILNNVIYTYGAMSSWKLKDLSHQEISWLKTRKGLKEYEKGKIPLSLEDIYQDAEKVRPYDHVWDMYYDEFADAEVAV